MIKNLLKKHSILLLVFFSYVSFLFVYQLNEDSILPYVNLILYFFIFILIKESLPLTKLDRKLVLLFFCFFAYLSIFMSVPILLRPLDPINFYAYVYFEVILKFLILLISIYVALYSIKFWIKSDRQRFWLTFALSLLITFINYFKFLVNPLTLYDANNWTVYAVRNYTIVVISLIALLIFWYRYYQKYIVVSEYLNLIIFIFTLSNIIEALHFLAFQHEFQIFIYGQVFSLGLNILMVNLWYFRLAYLNSDISIENERYLQNFQYLNGFVSKPKKSILAKVVPFFSVHYFTATLAGILVIISGLYLINKITFYLLLNTGFILLAVALALFFSFSSIKREWQSQVGILFKKNK